MLNQELLKKQLSSLLKDCVNNEREPDYFAGELAKIITNYIKTATVNAGIPVATAGTAVSQTGATTGPGTLS
jgi:hypothetical protein